MQPGANDEPLCSSQFSISPNLLLIGALGSPFFVCLVQLSNLFYPNHLIHQIDFNNALSIYSIFLNDCGPCSSMIDDRALSFFIVKFSITSMTCMVCLQIMILLYQKKTTTYSFTSFTFTVPSHSLLNSGANSINSKMPRQFQNCSVSLGNISAKKLLNSHHKHLYNRSAMALGYLDIFPRVMIWFFNS